PPSSAGTCSAGAGRRVERETLTTDSSPRRRSGRGRVGSGSAILGLLDLDQRVAASKGVADRVRIAGVGDPLASNHEPVLIGACAKVQDLPPASVLIALEPDAAIGHPAVEIARDERILGRSPSERKDQSTGNVRENRKNLVVCFGKRSRA